MTTLKNKFRFEPADWDSSVDDAYYLLADENIEVQCCTDPAVYRSPFYAVSWWDEPKETMHHISEHKTLNEAMQKAVEYSQSRDRGKQ